MLTEIEAIKMTRLAHRAEFRSMALGGRWHLCKGAVNVVLLPEHQVEDRVILVHDVQGLTEDATVNALSLALRRAA